MTRALSLGLALALTVGCSSAPDLKEQRLEKELRKALKERDQAREDYEADILQAFHRTELDHRFPYTGMPRVPDWVSPPPPEPKPAATEEEVLSRALTEWCKGRENECNPLPRAAAASE